MGNDSPCTTVPLHHVTTDVWDGGPWCRPHRTSCLAPHTPVGADTSPASLAVQPVLLP